MRGIENDVDYRPESACIDDESGDDQDLAAVVRRAFRIADIGSDLDADDEHFLFPDDSEDIEFANRRDVLQLEIELPDGSDGFTLLVYHTVSRYQGRATTEEWRESAASQLVEFLTQRIEDWDIVNDCDCNDSPDEQSVNILEWEDPTASAGMEEFPGPFMIDLTEPP